jgi:hypothetical protein
MRIDLPHGVHGMQGVLSQAAFFARVRTRTRTRDVCAERKPHANHAPHAKGV